jgi:hypothetical protein
MIYGPVDENVVALKDRFKDLNVGSNARAAFGLGKMIAGWKTPVIGPALGYTHPDLETDSDVVRACSTVFDRDRGLKTDPSKVASMTKDEFMGACFLDKGTCCEAVCRDGLRCHADARFMLKVKYRESSEGMCFRVPEMAITDRRIARMSEDDRARHIATVKVCITHHKTLTDAIATGSHWTFLRWAAYGTGVAICAFVIVPMVMAPVTAGAVAAVASVGIPTSIPATALTSAIPWVGGGVSGVAALTGVWRPMHRGVQSLPGMVNRAAMALDERRKRGRDDESDDENQPARSRRRV